MQETAAAFARAQPWIPQAEGAMEGVSQLAIQRRIVARKMYC